MKKILLAGYYGFGNIGDEAILEMLLKQICSITKLSNITVLSGNPAITRDKYNIESIYRYNIIKLFLKLCKSDVLIIGGGSLLQDVTSKKSIHYYLFIIKFAQILNKKVIMLSQGIGPIIGDYNRKATSAILRKVDFITVRDYNSKKIIEEMGVSNDQSSFSADPAINFGNNNKTKSNNVIKKVGFSLRNWKDTDITEEICKTVEELEKKNIKCCFLPFHFNEDINIIKNLEKKLGSKCIYFKNKLTADEAYELISKLDLLVGIRLHSLILSASAVIPLIGISYDPKIDYFMENLDMKALCNIKNIKCNILVNEILEKLDNHEEEKEILEKKVNILRKTTLVNEKILRKVLIDGD